MKARNATSSLFALFFSVLSFGYGTDATAAVSCTACVSDGGLGYTRECCETRVDSDGNPYEYCRTEDCLPGMDPPDTLHEGDAPGYTRPLTAKNPDSIHVIKFRLGPAINKP